MFTSCLTSVTIFTKEASVVPFKSIYGKKGEALLPMFCHSLGLLRLVYPLVYILFGKYFLKVSHLFCLYLKMSPRGVGPFKCPHGC